MLKSIVSLSLRHRGALFALTLMLVILGGFQLFKIQMDVFPEFAPPMAVVQTEAAGFTSQQVETLITQPIEDALNGTLGLSNMRSKSLQGLSMITLYFKEGTGLLKARQLVSEKLANLTSSLPKGVSSPQLLPLTTSTSVIMSVGLTAKTASPLTMQDIAKNTVKRQLLGVPGVADVIVFGDHNKEVQIQVDPDKLAHYQLTYQDVIMAAQAASGVRGSGFVENANQRIALITDSEITNPETLSKVFLRSHNGQQITLGDVASVRYAATPAMGAASVNGQPAVLLVIESQYGANTLKVTNALNHKLDSLKPELARRGIQLHPHVFEAAKFIHAATDHIMWALLTGAGLVIAVLFLFLMNARVAFISLIAIPVSLTAAVLVLNALGMTLNIMTMGGLAIALGEIVDDAIIDVENIFRRLRQNRHSETPKSVFEVVLHASLEVRSAVVYATFIVILLFMPVLIMSGVAGKLFSPLAMAYIAAVLASLAVALTLTPALAAVWLGGKELPEHDPKLSQWLKRAYRTLLMRIEDSWKSIVTIVALLCIIGIGFIPFFSASFIPQLREGHFIVHMGLAPGTSLTESMRVGHIVSEKLMKLPGVRVVAQRAGRANEVVDPTGVQLSEFDVDLKPMNAQGQEKTLEAMQKAISSVPGITTSINTFLIERIDETLSGATAPVVIHVFGQNLDNIDRIAQDISKALSQLKGTLSIRLQSPISIPQLSIKLRLDQLNRYDFRPTEVLDVISQAFSGQVTTDLHVANRTYPVRVILQPKDRTQVDAVKSLILTNSDGVRVSLGQLADIRQVSGRYQISHEDGHRALSILVNVGGRSLSSYVNAAKSLVAEKVSMPKSAYVIFSGENQARIQSEQDLLVYGGLALFGIVLLLLGAFKNPKTVSLIMLNLPFALLGGVGSVVLTGNHLTLGSLVGFVTLLGISLRNAVMLISHYIHLVQREGYEWNQETILQGASDRLIPILMTALVTSLGLLPLAITSGAAGNEIEGPMAQVILGGLITSTLLNLMVVPVLAKRFLKLDQIKSRVIDKP